MITGIRRDYCITIKILNSDLIDSPWTLEHLSIFQKLPVHQGKIEFIICMIFVIFLLRLISN